MTIVMALFFGHTINWILNIPTFLNFIILGYMFHQKSIIFLFMRDIIVRKDRKKK